MKNRKEEHWSSSVTKGIKLLIKREIAEELNENINLGNDLGKKKMQTRSAAKKKPEESEKKSTKKPRASTAKKDTKTPVKRTTRTTATKTTATKTTATKTTATKTITTVSSQKITTRQSSIKKSRTKANSNDNQFNDSSLILASSDHLSSDLLSLDESNLSISFGDENSPSKFNIQFGALALSDRSDDEKQTVALSKSVVFDRSDYEELEELPNNYDYQNVRLKKNHFIGYEEQQQELQILIRNAIGRGESGTVMVYGSPGSGKTSFVDHCLKNSEYTNNCNIIRLSGLVHGNDAATIRHIARCVKIDFNDLSRLMEKLKEESRNKIANLVIVLDEFEAFCVKNQFLLYNFFDLIQYVNYVMVIGITSRYDSIELLEKRVKSRMNHKIIDLKPPFYTLGEYLQFAKRLLEPEDVKFTKMFQRNLEIQFQKSFSIAQLKNCLLYNMRSKKANRFAYQGPVQRFLTGKDEKVNLICTHLTNLEIAVLLLACKLVFLKEKEPFNLKILTSLMNEIPSHMGVNQKLFMMATAILIDHDLFVIEEKRSQRQTKLFLTDWTPLVLNLFRFQIEESLKRISNRLPIDLLQLFSIQC